MSAGRAMKLRYIWTGLVCTAVAGIAQSADLGTQDYFSFQIASSGNAGALDKLFEKNTELPFLRIEQRGSLYVLRAGFWADAATAKSALSAPERQLGLLRIAVYKPSAIVRKNWTSQQDVDPKEPVIQGSAPVASTEKLRPFDEQDYVLAFDTLVAAGDLKRAFAIAQKAVQSIPLDRAWRLRLAKISQWTQRPEIAAEQWVYLFEQGDHSAETVAKVIAFAPSTDRPALALRAWGIHARQKSMTDAQWQGVYNLYDAAADPAAGAAFFVAQYQQTPQPIFLEFAARLAEGAGDDTQAETLYLKRAQQEPFSLDSILRVVTNQIRSGKLTEALEVMKTYEARVPENAADFWRMLSQLAWDLRDNDTARRGYEHYTLQVQSGPPDWERLILLLQENHPAQAAEMAIKSYNKFGHIEHLLLGLSLYATLADTEAQTRVFAALGDKAEAIAAKETRFLLLRARYYQIQKNLDAAWIDLRRARAQAPADVDVLLANLWFLVDNKKTAELGILLKAHALFALNQEPLWTAYAAASQLLDHPREATRWYEKILSIKKDDPLMLLNFADVRERLGQIGIADRLRRHAWLQLKTHSHEFQQWPATTMTAELLALTRLSMLNQPGDPGMALVRQLVHPLHGDQQPQQAEDIQTLVLGWSILKGQSHNAKSWMWRRYLHHMAKQAPLWAQAQTALELNDRPAMEALLLRSSDKLPIYNRYDIAYTLGHQQEALNTAFQGMSRQEDGALHDRYRQHVPQQAHYFQVETQSDTSGDLDSNRLQFETRLAITPDVFIVLTGSGQSLTVKEPTLAGLPSGQERVESIEVQWAGTDKRNSLALQQRDSLASGAGLLWRTSVQWDNHLSTDYVASYHAPSQISPAMRIAGYEDSIGTTVSYVFGKREYLRVTPQFANYFTQYGSFLGSGRSLDVEAGYRLRIEYPDWRIRVFAKDSQWSRADLLDAATFQRLPQDTQTAISNNVLDGIALFIPASSFRTGACIDMGENLAGQNVQLTYTRAWRPFGTVCLSQDSESGQGYSSTLGLAGSITGEDHIRLQWESTQGATPTKANTNAVTLRYRHYF
jgi:polysaccharide biosynthesis protein PelB